jgi:hypothetical protein
MKHSSMQVAFGLVLGAGVGAAIAIIAGVGGVWLAVGVALGVVIGSSLTRRSKTASGGSSELAPKVSMRSKQELL